MWCQVTTGSLSRKTKYKKQQHLTTQSNNKTHLFLSTKMGTEQSKNNDTQPKQKQMTRQERSAQQAQKAIGR